MLEVVLPIPFWFEMVATISGSISGAMAATRARYDIFGTIIIATILGLFGGVIRDVMLQDYGIYAFQHPIFIIGCVITAGIVFYFGTLVTYLNRFIDVIDALVVGMWAILGAGKAISAGMGIVPSIILGIVTAIGGGITRDVLMNRPVRAFQPGTLYGTAALIGTTIYCLMRTYHILDDYSAVLCAALIITIVLLSMTFDWRTKPSKDLTVPLSDAMAKPVRALRDHPSLHNEHRHDERKHDSHAAQHTTHRRSK